MKDGRQVMGISRRAFAKISAAAAGVAILTSKRTAAQTRAKATSDVLKVGLLGCGSRGTGALGNCLTGNKNCKVIAMADLFQDRLQDSFDKISKGYKDQFAVDKDHCFVGFDAYKKILATDIDILIEGTLPYSRPKHVAAAVDAKKHIFTEKPVAVDPAGIRLVMEASKKHKEAGMSFVAGTQRRHQKEYIEGIKALHDGAIGDIVAMRVYWCGGLPFAKDRKPEWSDFEYCVRNWYAHCWVCGDNIVEQHVHNLDVANWVLNSHPAEVFASGGRSWKPAEEKYGDLWDHFDCDYRYDVGGKEVHVFSFSRHWDGCDGGVFENAWGTKGFSECVDKKAKGTDAYVQEHIDLVNSVLDKGPYLHEGQQVAESTMTAIMGRMSAYTGKALKWDEALNSDLSIVPEEWSFEKKYPYGPVPKPLVKV